MSAYWKFVSEAECVDEVFFSFISKQDQTFALKTIGSIWIFHEIHFKESFTFVKSVSKLNIYYVTIICLRLCFRMWIIHHQKIESVYACVRNIWKYLKVFSFAFSKLILSQHKVYWTLRAQASLCANGTSVLLLSFSKSPDWFIGSFSWKSLSACMTLQGKAGKAMTGFNALQDHRGHESTLLLYKVLSQRAFTLWSPYVSTNKRGSEGRTKSTKHPQDAAFPPTVGQCLRASHVTQGTCWWSHTIPASLFHTLAHRLHPFPHPQPQCSSTFSLIGMWGRRNRARGGGRLRPLWVFF